MVSSLQAAQPATRTLNDTTSIPHGVLSAGSSSCAHGHAPQDTRHRTTCAPLKMPIPARRFLPRSKTSQAYSSPCARGKESRATGRPRVFLQTTSRNGRLVCSERRLVGVYHRSSNGDEQYAVYPILLLAIRSHVAPARRDRVIRASQEHSLYRCEPPKHSGLSGTTCTFAHCSGVFATILNACTPPVSSSLNAVFTSR